ncbi:hypothetical protein DPMN_168913 [Dreissena polymorpha]|uniref:SMC hinge domain-containing protein n=1 Tax=Dreissena polymorpha TaxID=45954 RepID=A0A9D4F629_DREPO|nr:hypothetical protein DPMN_168913 [Dreissena polymorpha]
MATAPDSQRLKLLREVAGTKVYDERKEESKEILRETVGQNEEYTIHDHELRDTKKKLDELQDKRDNSGAQTQKYRDLQQAANDKVKKDLKDLKTRTQTVHEEKDMLQTENQESTKDKAKLELTIKDMQEDLEGDAKTKCNEKIAKTQKSLEIPERQGGEVYTGYHTTGGEVYTGYHTTGGEVYTATGRKSAHKTSNVGYLKNGHKGESSQGRGNQFTSRDDRDSWIKNELKSLNKAIKDKEEQEEKRREMLETRITDINQRVEQHKEIIESNNRSYNEMKGKKDELQNERSALWREENVLQQNLVSLRDELSKKEQGLRSMTGKLLKVLQSFKEQGINQELIDGYYGTLIEMFDCDKTFFTCVEVTAGGRLFHHVVDSDRTGTAILQEMNRKGLPGEVTFMPLNRLDNRDTIYPETNDAIPMISKLRYSDKYAAALKHHGIELSVSVQARCPDRSRLDLHKSKEEYATKYNEHKTKLEDIEGQGQGQGQRMETRNSKNRDNFEKMRGDVRLMTEELANLTKTRESYSESKESYTWESYKQVNHIVDCRVARLEQVNHIVRASESYKQVNHIVRARESYKQVNHIKVVAWQVGSCESYTIESYRRLLPGKKVQVNHIVRARESYKKVNHIVRARESYKQGNHISKGIINQVKARESYTRESYKQGNHIERARESYKQGNRISNGIKKQSKGIIKQSKGIIKQSIDIVMSSQFGHYEEHSDLSAEDQGEMDGLNDQIKQLTQQNKDSLKERIRQNKGSHKERIRQNKDSVKERIRIRLNKGSLKERIRQNKGSLKERIRVRLVNQLTHQNKDSLKKRIRVILVNQLTQQNKDSFKERIRQNKGSIKERIRERIRQNKDSVKERIRQNKDSVKERIRQNKDSVKERIRQNKDSLKERIRLENLLHNNLADMEEEEGLTKKDKLDASDERLRKVDQRLNEIKNSIKGGESL